METKKHPCSQADGIAAAGTDELSNTSNSEKCSTHDDDTGFDGSSSRPANLNTFGRPRHSLVRKRLKGPKILPLKHYFHHCLEVLNTR